jgi:hypothetical protein
MVVEPESLCWLTGRMVKARDGVTWASNSRPLECVSSWLPHFDSDTMIGHPPLVEKEMR